MLAKDRGFAAAKAGKPITDNPYTKPVYWLAWRKGWMAFNLSNLSLRELDETLEQFP